jgi:hypothetical protein
VTTSGKKDEKGLPFWFRSDKVLRELAFPDSFALIFAGDSLTRLLEHLGHHR